MDNLLAKKASEKWSSFLNSPSSFLKQLRGTNIKGFWELRGICRAACMGQGVEGDGTM